MQGRVCTPKQFRKSLKAQAKFEAAARGENPSAIESPSRSTLYKYMKETLPVVVKKTSVQNIRRLIVSEKRYQRLTH